MLQTSAGNWMNGNLHRKNLLSCFLPGGRWTERNKMNNKRVWAWVKVQTMQYKTTSQQNALYKQLSYIVILRHFKLTQLYMKLSQRKEHFEKFMRKCITANNIQYHKKHLTKCNFFHFYIYPICLYFLTNLFKSLINIKAF